jgi:hypothetical protein
VFGGVSVWRRQLCGRRCWHRAEPQKRRPGLLSIRQRRHVTRLPRAFVHLGQERQNFLPGVTGVPQLGQAASSRAPQSSQNRAPASVAAWHRGHVIQSLQTVERRRVGRSRQSLPPAPLLAEQLIRPLDELHEKDRIGKRRLLSHEIRLQDSPSP